MQNYVKIKFEKFTHLELTDSLSEPPDASEALLCSESDITTYFHCSLIHLKDGLKLV
jgi:hypothetical protein